MQKAKKETIIHYHPANQACRETEELIKIINLDFSKYQLPLILKKPKFHRSLCRIKERRRKKGASLPQLQEADLGLP